MKNELLRIYLKYKKQIVPIVLISVSFFIIFRIILPTTTEISEANQEIESKEREAEELQATLDTLSSLNDSETEGNIEVVTKALPDSKDISIIFSAITGVASEANVTVSDFSLTVGGLYGRAAGTNTNTTSVPSLEVTVRFESTDPKNFIALSDNLQKRLPLVEIKTVDISSTRALYELGFFYKPVDLALLSKSAKIEPLTQADLNLLNELKTWDN